MNEPINPQTPHRVHNLDDLRFICPELDLGDVLEIKCSAQGEYTYQRFVGARNPKENEPKYLLLYIFECMDQDCHKPRREYGIMPVENRRGDYD